MHPALGRLGFLDSAEVVAGEARDAHVVVALQDKLDVTNLERGRRSELGEATGLGDDLVNKVVCHLEDELYRSVSLSRLAVNS